MAGVIIILGSCLLPILRVASRHTNDSIDINRDTAIIFIAVDNNFTLYVDGNLKISGNDWRITYNTTVSRTVRLLAVDATDKDGGYGIRVVSDVISTTSVAHWKCINPTRVPNKDWIQVGYNDSNWPIASNNSGNAFKESIWASCCKGKSRIYCRGKTACYNSTCVHGDCYNTNSSFDCHCKPGYTGRLCEEGDGISVALSVGAAAGGGGSTIIVIIIVVFWKKRKKAKRTNIVIKNETSINDVQVQASPSGPSFTRSDTFTDPCSKPDLYETINDACLPSNVTKHRFEIIDDDKHCRNLKTTGRSLYSCVQKISSRTHNPGVNSAIVGVPVPKKGDDYNNSSYISHKASNSGGNRGKKQANSEH